MTDTAYLLRLTLDQLASHTRPRRLHARQTFASESARCIAAIGGPAVLPGRDSLALAHDCTDFDLEHDWIETLEEAGDIAIPVRLHLEAPAQPGLPGLVDEDGEPDAEMSDPDTALGLAMLGELAEFPARAETSSRALTPSEAVAVMQGLRQTITARTGRWQAIVLLAVSLLSGRSLSALLQLPRMLPRQAGQSWWARTGRGAAVRFGIGFCPAVTDAPPPPANGIVLVMPDWLQAPLDRLLGEMPDPATLEADARHVLAGLLPEGRALRRSRLGMAARSAGMDLADLVEHAGGARAVRTAVLPWSAYPAILAQLREADGGNAELAEATAAAFALLAWGGLRVDEATSRTVADLDVDLSVHVHATATHSGKSAAARRRVPMGPVSAGRSGGLPAGMARPPAGSCSRPAPDTALRDGVIACRGSGDAGDDPAAVADDHPVPVRARLHAARVPPCLGKRCAAPAGPGAARAGHDRGGDRPRCAKTGAGSGGAHGDAGLGEAVLLSGGWLPAADGIQEPEAPVRLAGAVSEALSVGNFMVAVAAPEVRMEGALAAWRKALAPRCRIEP